MFMSDSEGNAVRMRSVSFLRTSGLRRRLYVIPERNVAAGVISFLTQLGNLANLLVSLPAKMRSDELLSISSGVILVKIRFEPVHFFISTYPFSSLYFRM